MNYRRLSEHELAQFLRNIRDRLAGGELTALDPSVMAALLAEIGTLPEELSLHTNEAMALKERRMASVSARNDTRSSSRKVSSRLREILKALDAPDSQFELCGFDPPANRVSRYVAIDPEKLTAVGYHNGVNRLKFKGNNRHGLVSYEIWRRDSRDAAWALIATTPKQSFEDSPVKPGQFHEYRTRAVATRSVSNYSNTAIVYGSI